MAIKFTDKDDDEGKKPAARSVKATEADPAAKEDNPDFPLPKPAPKPRGRKKPSE